MSVMSNKSAKNHIPISADKNTFSKHVFLALSPHVMYFDRTVDPFQNEPNWIN